MEHGTSNHLFFKCYLKKNNNIYICIFLFLPKFWPTSKVSTCLQSSICWFLICIMDWEVNVSRTSVQDLLQAFANKPSQILANFIDLSGMKVHTKSLRNCGCSTPLWKGWEDLEAACIFSQTIQTHGLGWSHFLRYTGKQRIFRKERNLSPMIPQRHSLTELHHALCEDEREPPGSRSMHKPGPANEWWAAPHGSNSITRKHKHGSRVLNLILPFKEVF